MMNIEYDKGLTISNKDLRRLRFYKAKVNSFCDICSKRDYNYSTSKDTTNYNIKKGSYCFGICDYKSEYSGRCCLNCFKKFINKFKSDLNKLNLIADNLEKEYKENKEEWIKNNVVVSI